MNHSFAIFIYGHPVSWARATPMRRGHAIEPRVQRIYKRRARTLIRIEMAGRDPITGPVKMTATFGYPWTKTRKASKGKHHISAPDLDNLLKMAGDCLSRIVIRDDRQVCKYITAWKQYELDPKQVGMYIFVCPFMEQIA